MYLFIFKRVKPAWNHKYAVTQCPVTGTEHHKSHDLLGSKDLGCSASLTPTLTTCTAVY